MTNNTSGAMAIRLTRTHDRRLRAMYRSAGWPCLDAIEIELLAAGLLERVPDGRGSDWLRVTDAGIARLAELLHQNRQAFDAHEALVDRVARDMAAQGRIAFTDRSSSAPKSRVLRAVGLPICCKSRCQIYTVNS